MAQEVENKRQPEAWRHQLLEGANTLGLRLSSAQADKLLAYVALMARWNKRFNLTAIRDPRRVVSHHLLDCLAIVPFVRGGRILDVGAGAGLPGIPLAIAFPGSQIVLLDSNGKKVRFLIQAAAELGLDNIEVVHQRVEAYRPQQAFDCIVARAFAAVPVLLEWAGHLCRPDGRFLLMKGRFPRGEINAIAQDFVLVDDHPLAVPGVEGERRLLIVAPA